MSSSSYQDQEVLPVLLDTVDNNNAAQTKQSFGLAGLAVLCLAVTSFLAGRAHGTSSSHAAASATAAATAKYAYCFELDNFRDTVAEECGGDESAQCVYNVIVGDKIFDVAGDVTDISTCNLNGSSYCGDFTLPMMQKYCVD